MSDLTALSSKYVLLPEGLSAATLLLENGRIVSILPERLPSTKAQPVKDYGDSVIMPGLIDSHVRMDEPGHSDWEGFEYATAAAAAGGITTVIDLPLDCNPVTTNLDALKSKIRAADGNLTVNCGFWGGIIPTNQEQIEPMAKAGVFGFCLFLSDSGNADFPTIPVSDLERIAPRLAATNLPIGFHAVLPSGKSGKLKKPKDEYSYKAFLESLPDSFETEAAKEIIKLCTKHALDAHLLHVSSSEVLPMIEQARKKGVTISAETCPHYLYFSADKIPDHDTRFKCDPPIRDEANRNSLWTGLERGDLSFIVSDHRPAPAEMKEIETGHFTKSRSGIPSLQFTLPVCWTAAQSMKIPLGKLSFWMSTSVAERFGLDTKGVIKEGFDADLVIWNPAKKMKVNKHIIRSRHAYSPYEGEMLSGVVEETWVGGIKVYDRGDFPNKHSGKVLLKNLSL